MTTFERLQTKMATLPSTRDTLHDCTRCGQRAMAYHEHSTANARREFIKCASCGYEVTLKIRKS